VAGGGVAGGGIAHAPEPAPVNRAGRHSGFGQLGGDDDEIRPSGQEPAGHRAVDKRAAHGLLQALAVITVLCIAPAAAT